MSRSSLPLGNEYIDQFPVFEADGVSKRSGETAFTVTVWRDGVVQAVVPVVEEIGTSGEYRVRLTPTVLGVWAVEVVIAYNQQVWFGAVDVEQPPVQFLCTAADDAVTAVFAIWLEWQGQRMMTVTSVAARIKDAAGALVVDLGVSTSPGADGAFRFSTASGGLVPHRAYIVAVQAVVNGVTLYGNIGFAEA